MSGLASVLPQLYALKELTDKMGDVQQHGYDTSHMVQNLHNQASDKLKSFLDFKNVLGKSSGVKNLALKGLKMTPQGRALGLISKGNHLVYACFFIIIVLIVAIIVQVYTSKAENDNSAYKSEWYAASIITWIAFSVTCLFCTYRALKS